MKLAKLRSAPRHTHGRTVAGQHLAMLHASITAPGQPYKFPFSKSLDECSMLSWLIVIHDDVLSRLLLLWRQNAWIFFVELNSLESFSTAIRIIKFEFTSHLYIFIYSSIHFALSFFLSFVLSFFRSFFLSLFCLNSCPVSYLWISSLAIRLPVVNYHISEFSFG